MSENGGAPAPSGESQVGGGAATMAPETGGGRSQPTHDQIRGEAKQTRGPDGKFGAKPDDGPKVMNRGDFNRVAGEAARAFMGKETDRAALDAVKPTGKDPAAKTDQGKPATGTKATAKDGQQDTTGADPARAEKLELAKKHLKLDRWTDAKLAILTDEQVLALGKESQDEHAAKYREGEERAAAAKSKPETGKATKAPEEADAAEAAEYEKLAKEHFGNFDGPAEEFSKAIAGFGRATASRQMAALDAHVTKLADEFRETILGIRGQLNDQLHFEVGVRELRDSFPQAATADGRKALAGRYEALRKADPNLDARTALEQASDSLWGAELRKANAERKERINSAKQGAHADPTTQGEPQRPMSFKDVARDKLRETGVI